jgi:farnesyl diphosphate synthase
MTGRCRPHARRWHVVHLAVVPASMTYSGQHRVRRSPLRRTPPRSDKTYRTSIVFSERLAEAQTLVEQRLASWLADGATPGRMTDAMRHAVLGGGKRIRPFLVLESSRLFDVDPAAALDVAAALECVHCYSLVHDDLPAMDNDRLRRGRPTVWAAFDEWTAILAGDGLLTLAFEIIAGSTSPMSASKRVALTLELARASGRAGMVGGQCIDLEADKLGRPAQPPLEHIRHLQALKTGALIRFGCIAGAILGNAAATERAALVTYGERLGFAFQIADDLLDATGDEATVGKAVAKDAAAGKATLVSLMGITAARARLAATEAEAVAALEIFGQRAATLIEAAAFVANRTS